MKTRSLLAAGWLLAVVLCLSCGRRDLTEVLDRAEACMLEQPDSALHLLQTVDRTHISGASHRARYALLYSQALDKNYIDVDNDSLIRVAVDYYKRRGDAHEKALAYFYLGRIYDNAGDETQATEAFVEAETHALNTDDHYICGLIYSYLGNLYFAQYSFDEALDMYDKSEKCYARAGQLRNEGYMIEAKARVYNLSGNTKACFREYERAIKLFSELNDVQYVAFLTCDLSMVKFQSADYESLSLEDLNLTLNSLYSNKDLTFKSLVFYKDNNLDSARYYAKKALTDNKFESEKQIAGIYYFLSIIERKLGNYKLAFECINHYAAQMDSINLFERSNLIQKIEKRYNNTLLKNSLVAQETFHMYQLKIICLLVFFGIVFFILVLIRLIKKRKLIEVKKDQEIKAYKLMTEDLSSNYDELKVLYDRLSSERDQNDETEIRFIKALDSRLRGLGQLLEEAYLFPNKPERFLRKFQEYVRDSTTKEFAFTDLRYVVNKKYYGIIDYLNKTYPDLSESDLDLCSMICFGFCSNSIRQIYAHTNPDSLYNKRSKLRNKLKLRPSIQIEGFIRNLLTELSKSNAI